MFQYIFKPLPTPAVQVPMLSPGVPLPDARHRIYLPGFSVNYTCPSSQATHHTQMNDTVVPQKPAELQPHRRAQPQPHHPVSYHTMQPQRPVMSYIAMIAKAILSTQDEHMKLSDNCQFLECTIPYYLTAQVNWRSAIRHSCFVKRGRSGTGRGSMWTIHPACLGDFRCGDYRRNLARKRVQTDNNMKNNYPTTAVSRGCSSPVGPASLIQTVGVCENTITLPQGSSFVQYVQQLRPDQSKTLSASQFSSAWSVEDLFR